MEDQELVLPQYGRAAKAFTDKTATPEATTSKRRPNGRTSGDRKREAMRTLRRGKSDLSEQQKQQLDAVYGKPAVERYPSFSLSATLALYPDLIDSYTPDWNLEDGQLAFETLSNKPILFKRAAKTVDPFA